jgi:hypothetical protein
MSKLCSKACWYIFASKVKHGKEKESSRGGTWKEGWPEGRAAEFRQYDARRAKRTSQKGRAGKMEEDEATKGREVTNADYSSELKDIASHLIQPIDLKDFVARGLLKK